MKCDLCEKLSNRNTRIKNLTDLSHSLADDNERLRIALMEVGKKKVFWRGVALFSASFNLGMVIVLTWKEYIW